MKCNCYTHFLRNEQWTGCNVEALCRQRWPGCAKMSRDLYAIDWSRAREEKGTDR